MLAHGIGAIQDLPVPAWLFYYGAALVLVASFVALGVLWKEPRLERARERPLPPGLQRVLLSPVLRVVLGALSVALLVLVVAAGLVGDGLADPQPGADLRLRRLLAGHAAPLRPAGRRLAGAEPVAGSGGCRRVS